MIVCPTAEQTAWKRKMMLQFPNWESFLVGPFSGSTLPKTNMTMEHHHFRWEIHLQMVGFPIVMLGFPELYVKIFGGVFGVPSTRKNRHLVPQVE